MPRAARFVLMAAYPWLLALRVAGTLVGSGPLRVKKRSEGSYWRVRPDPPAPWTYFAAAETRTRRSATVGRLTWLAERFGPRRAPADSSGSAPAGGDVPDEIYTLW